MMVVKFSGMILVVLLATNAVAGQATRQLGNGRGDGDHNAIGQLRSGRWYGGWDGLPYIMYARGVGFRGNSQEVEVVGGEASSNADQEVEVVNEPLDEVDLPPLDAENGYEALSNEEGEEQAKMRLRRGDYDDLGN